MLTDNAGLVRVAAEVADEDDKRDVSEVVGADDDARLAARQREPTLQRTDHARRVDLVPHQYSNCVRYIKMKKMKTD